MKLTRIGGGIAHFFFHVGHFSVSAALALGLGEGWLPWTMRGEGQCGNTFLQHLPPPQPLTQEPFLPSASA